MININLHVVFSELVVQGETRYRSIVLRDGQLVICSLWRHEDLNSTPANLMLKSWCAGSREEAETNDPCSTMASLPGLIGKLGVPVRDCLKKQRRWENGIQG